jgi:dihydroorotate dehydrogenase (fumarate)
MTANLDSIKQIEEMGAGALVTRSLFEEQIQLERFEFDEALHKEDCRNAEMITVSPNIEYLLPHEHLSWVKRAKQAVNIPVIASLNAVNKDTWIEYAKLLEKTGVDALECNLFASPKESQHEGAAIELEQIELIKELVKTISIPISVKLSFSYTNPLNVIERMDAAGASAFVLFNRLFEPDIDAKQETRIYPINLSHATDHRLPLRYAGLLEGTIKADICSSTGISTGEDVAKMILAGATAVQTVSTLLRHKITHIRSLLKELSEWMEVHEYSTLAAFQGTLSRRHSADPWAYTRAQYVKLMMSSPEILSKPSTRKD